jgi:type III secretion protein V
MTTAENILSGVAKRYDLLVVAFILLITALMILPLPTWLMDLMIGLNMTIAIQFLMMAVYMKQALDFSTLPSAMLLATLVRVAITIATSRLILANGDAGSIITSFGEFVIAGNVVVGLVIFSIIAIAQFVVITRGAERVAEVAARFTLDAMPGKQMSIDGDLRAGDIDRNEARRRRSRLERESQFYGAMDGAMKFVKGDAIVSVVVMLINLLGGLAIGTLVRGLDVQTAFNTYALLTVGDGLAAQLPALLIAVASGIIVTRVNKEQASNLGADLGAELASSAPALFIASAALLALAIVPGFPTVTFLGLSAVMGLGATKLVLQDRRAATAAEDAAKLTAAAATEAPPAPTSFVLRLAPDVWAALDRPTFDAKLQQRLADGASHYGILLPRPLLVEDHRLTAGNALFAVDGAPTWEAQVYLDRCFARATADLARLADIAITAEADLPVVGHGLWISPEAAADIEQAGAVTLDAATALAEVTVGLVGRWVERAFGLQEVDTWLTSLSERGLTGIVSQLRQIVPLTRLANVLQLLLAEQVSLSQPRLVLEALLELAPRIDDNADLTDHLRLALSRPISAQFANDRRSIGAYVVEYDLERVLASSMQRGPGGMRLKLASKPADQLAALATPLAQHLEWSRPRAVVLTAFSLRRSLRRFFISRGIDVPVLAFEEIAPDYAILPLQPLSLAEIEFDLE